MKRALGIAIASAAVVLPAAASGGTHHTQVAEYSPHGESAYQSGKAVFDPVLAQTQSVSSVLLPLEASLCGANRHMGPQPS